MTTMTMTNTKHHRLSLKERFANYVEKYGVQVTCGLLALNGDFHAYRLYTEMTGRR